MDRNSQKLTKQVFMSQEEAERILHGMEDDATLKTEAGVARDPHYPNQQKLSFFERHAAYLKSHPKVNPLAYLTNLRTMIKKRP